MGADRPKIRWQTYALAVVWAVVFIVIAWGSGAFRGIFQGIVHEGYVSLPRLTTIFLRVPAEIWALLGILGAGAIVAKSALMPPKRARLVDRIALGLLVLVATTAVLVAVPLVKLALSIRIGSAKPTPCQNDNITSAATHFGRVRHGTVES